MKKIGIVITNIENNGGAERSAVNLANELTKLYEVHLIGYFGKNSYYNLNNKVKLHVLVSNIDNNDMKIKKQLIKLSILLREYVKNNSLEILIVINRYTVLPTVMSKFTTKVKLLCCEHSSLNGYEMIENNFLGKIHRIILLNYIYKFVANRVIFLTKRDADIYSSKYSCSNKAIYIYNFIDDMLLLKVNQYKIKSKKIITVGRINFAKGYEYLIKVAKLVFAKYPDWTWYIYGDGDVKYKNKIISLIKENNLQNNIILQGNHSNIYDLYQEYSFYVMTSRYEGLPMVLLEAKAKKLPIVSFDINSGPSDIVRDGIDGLLVRAFDCNAMAEKICELIKNRELRQKFSDNAHGNINKFNKKKIIEQWRNLIEQIINE